MFKIDADRLNADSLRKNHQEFIKTNELILETEKGFKSKRHNMKEVHLD